MLKRLDFLNSKASGLRNSGNRHTQTLQVSGGLSFPFEDRFLYIMKNLPTFAEKPQLWDDPYFDDIMEEAEFANMTIEQRMQYSLAMKQRWDYKNTLDFAEKKGREEGIEEGRASEKERIVASLRAQGVSEDIIAKVL